MSGQTRFAPPTPDLPVRNLNRAVAYNRDALGFELCWENGEGRIAGVARGDWTLFLRKVDTDVSTHVCWVFVADVSAAYEDLRERQVDVLSEPEDKPWGLRQFSVRDADSHVFHLHHDL